MFQIGFCPDSHQSLTALHSSSRISIPTTLTVDDSTPAVAFPVFLGVGTEKSHSKNIWGASHNIHHKTVKEELKQELAHLFFTNGRDLTSEGSVNCSNSLHENYC